MCVNEKENQKGALLFPTTLSRIYERIQKATEQLEKPHEKYLREIWKRLHEHRENWNWIWQAEEVISWVTSNP